MNNTNIIDRRKNAKNKGVGIRQKFIRRAKTSIKKAVKKAIDDKAITDINNDSGTDKVSIPIKDIKEQSFGYSKKNKRGMVLPGNKDFVPGDKINKPEQGQGGGGTEGSDSGEGEDEFSFTLTREEFLEFFFDDLELPDLVKTQLTNIEVFKNERAGYTTSGSPNNLDLVRTMRNSIGRRIALQSPYVTEIKKLEDKLLKLKPEDKEYVEILVEIKELKLKRDNVPFIDDIDVRYRSFKKVPSPNTQAVMFCIMDVSASMGEYEKGLAKRFFMLLHMFLFKKYEKIDVVFIRHHTIAKECNEEEFFYSKETGGTIASSALDLANDIIQDRYNASSWNIYVAHCSDGDNFSHDTSTVRDILNDTIMPYVQYYSYVEIAHDTEPGNWGYGMGGNTLWKDFEPLTTAWKNFKMAKINKPGEIFPVFRDLFKKKDS